MSHTIPLTASVLPNVAQVSPYQPGRSIQEIKRKYGLDFIIKLASNENPFGPSPKVLEAISQALTGLHYYPDPGFALYEALANHLNVQLNQLILGNGSDAILLHAAQAFAGPGDDILMAQYSFATYKIICHMVGANPIEVPTRGWDYDLPAMLNAITPRTKLIYIANPNNPTGVWIKHNDLVNFLKAVPRHVLVVLDEAYVEYVVEPEFPKGLLLLKDFSNLLLTRTFSKMYALAGLRVGYGIGHPELINLINKMRLPFTINNLGLIGAAVALSDPNHQKKALAHNIKAKTILADALTQLHLEQLPSIANFITFKSPIAGETLAETLVKQGVIIRPLLPYGLTHHLRVSVGTDAENEFFIEKLTAVL